MAVLSIKIDLDEILVNIYRYWLEAEPKHTQELRKRIVDNIQGKIKDKYTFFDEAIAKECGERLYRGQYVDENQAQKLRKIKSPGLIVLISNEPTHEIKERLIKMKRTNDKEKKDEEIKRISRIIEKIETCIKYAISDEAEIDEEVINKKENIEEQAADYMIKEIKVREKWKKKKEEIQQCKINCLETLIEENKDKGEEELNVGRLQQLIHTLREKLAGCSNEAIKEIELGIELENMDDMYYMTNRNKKEKEVKRPPGRPKKQVRTDSKQIKIEDMLC